MARIQPNTHQSKLIEKDIPEMPGDYYSSGPNPNLRRFVEEHATPFDNETDDYQTAPFDKPIKTTKNTAIYNMHGYMGKKPHDAVRAYIRHYTEPGNIVLDPFCGSGGTSLAALVEERVAVALDISPAATLITKHYCTPVSIKSVRIAYKRVHSHTKAELEWLYETRCDRCDGRATTDHMVFSHTYQCPRCLSKVPLFDCIEAEGVTAKGTPKKIKACPNCFERGHVEEISTRSERLEAIPVLVGYICQEGCKPKTSERRYNDSDPKKRKYFSQYDLEKLIEIEEKTIPHWVPPHRMMHVESDTEPWGDKWRAGTSNFRTIIELYTKRNLWAIAAIFNAISALDDGPEKPVLNLSLTGFLTALSKMQRYYPTSSFPNMTIPGTYYMPPVYSEENAEKYFANKVERNVKGLQVLNEVVSSTDCLISTQSATDLSAVNSNSIDYIYTDPPYSGNVQYGELNFLMEAWLNLNTHWHDQEIIVNETRALSERDWANAMTQAMSECFRVLKPGRWLSLCYHDTSEGTWQLVQDLMAAVGFISEQLESALYIDTEQKSYNQYSADKVTRRDLVINFRKPRPNEMLAQLTLFGNEDAATFAEKSQAILGELLEDHPGSTVDRLFDELVSRMVRKGEFERHNFNEILRSVAEEVEGRWYLLETADQIDAAESGKEEGAANHIEYFMQQYLADNPTEQGVHYSDLFEQYLPYGDKPRRLLQHWLPEFFFKTADGTWRPPANDEERQQKAALRESGTLRRIKRFGNALLDGVPPADRDRPENAATAADWIRQCRRAGLYELGRVLYEKGSFSFDELSDEAQLEVEEDYQICVRRS